jgi:capsular exopolysaccharide synthesis family protein
VYAVQQQPNLYQARSALMLGQTMNNPNPTSQEFGLAQQLGRTYVNIAKRAPVRMATMEVLGLTWLPEYIVSMVPNTQLIEISVNDTSPERAAVVANELANQILLSGPTSAQEQEDQERQAFINMQLDDMQALIETTKAEIVIKGSELAEMISARQISDAQSQIAALENKLRTLERNYVDLLGTTQQGAINSLTLFEEAAVPTRPIGPNRTSTVLTAAAIGFVLGAAAAYLLEYLDDTVKTPADVKNLTELPTLAGIARIPKKDEEEYQLVTRKQPRSSISEAYRTLRTGIMFANIDKPADMILITSPSAGEGKSVTVANLGVVMAQTGHKVLIVDADLRRPVQHEIFDLRGNQQGLTNVLLTMIVEQDGATTAEEVFDLLEGMIHETEQPRLYVLTSGMLPPNPAELVGSEKMGILLKTLASYYDFVILESPPILAVTDAVVLSARVDGVVLVSSVGETRRDQLEKSVAKLKDVNANIIGVLLNRVKAGIDADYYPGHSSEFYYQDDSSSGDSPTGEPGSRQPAGKSGGSRIRLSQFLVRLRG